MCTKEDSGNSGERSHYAAGEIIFSEGDPADGVYIVDEGEVELLLDGMFIGSESAGGIIGEMALINETVRSATARAKSDCRLYLIDRAQFLSMIENSPSFVLHIMKVMSDRVHRANELVHTKNKRE